MAEDINDKKNIQETIEEVLNKMEKVLKPVKLDLLPSLLEIGMVLKKINQENDIKELWEAKKNLERAYNNLEDKLIEQYYNYENK